MLIDGIEIPDTEVGPFKKRGNRIREWGNTEFLIAMKYLQTFKTCLDIGGHVGLTTLRYSKYFKEVHLFEPVLHDYAKKNTVNNTNVTVYPYAVSDKKQKLKMYPNPANTGRSIVDFDSPVSKNIIEKSFKSPDGKYHHVDPIQVESVTIDSYEFTDVSFIKIDVEGYNLPVIDGMKETLSQNSPVIQMEECGDSFMNKVAIDTMKSLGYNHVDTNFANPKDWYFIKK